MWIGLRFGTAWRWSDASSLAYARWHPENPPSTARDQCVVLILQPADPAQHGRWKTRPCDIRPAGEITGFVCQGREDSCGPPEPVHFALPGGMGPHATADVAFSLSVRSACSLSLTGLRAKTNTSATLFWLSLESNSTHVHSSIASELGGFLVRKVFPGVPFVPGISMWSFVTYPDGFATFFNQQEHFRLSEVSGISFAGLSSLQISGATVLNATLEHRLSSEVHFPGGRGMKLEEAIRRYLGNFTVGLWLRSLSTGHPKMCVVSYALKWKPPEFALFLLSPLGRLEFHLKGAVMFSETRGALLDGSWHHVAVSVSSAPDPLPVQVFVDGEPWEPSSAGGGRRFWKKGLSLGGTLCVGQLEIDGRGTSFYVGDLSEVNLWDQALSGYSVKQLAASRTKWKYPGNVVSWAQLVAAPSLPLQINTSLSEDPEAAFVWFGSLRLRGKPSVLCSDPEQALVYVAPTQAQCLRGVFWGLQLNGRLRRVGDPPSCLLVAPDGVSLLSGSKCSSDAKNSFRLLPDQRLQNLHSGLCLFQDMRSARLFLGKCASQALHFVLDWEVYCPQSQAWRSWKDTCLFLVLDAALEWSQALTFCQRFHGGSLVTLRGPRDLAWLQEELQVSVWTGLRSSGRDLWSWADGAPFNPVLRRFMSSWGTSRMRTCMVALPSGFLKAEPCHRPHRWICQVPHQTDSYVTFPGKSIHGALSADLGFRSLRVARRQCSALGRGCSAVLSTPAGHRLSLGTRFVTLTGSAADPATATAATAAHVKMRCSPGYSGQDCQSMCPPCEPRLSCNPLSGLCEGLLHHGQAPAATVSSLKCLPLGVWVFERGVCLSAERYGKREEAASACQRYLGATARKIRPPLGQAPDGFAGPEASGVEPDGFLWACQRAEDVEMPSFQEKLLISLLGPTPHQRHRSLPEAQAACYLQEERCTGLLTLNGAHYTVGGTVLVDSPGSGGVLYVKAACSPGFCGDRCQRRCSPCLSTHVYNPLTGHCDGLLRCVRRFSPSCAHGLVHSRCPQQPGWWFWGGHCYYVEEHSAKDWRGAQAACQAHGKETDLLTLSSSREKGWVMAVVQRSSWTGLNDADQDGTWTWARGQPADLSSPWLAGIQLPTGGCLEIGRPRGRDLAASPCSELKAWVCEGPWAPWSPCPTEWSHWNGSCYFWDPLLSVGRWTDALRACRRFKGTELLSLTLPQERDWVRRNFRGSFWTGLNDRKAESVFRWTTEEPLGREMAQYLRDDLADGGLKDCVWFEAATGLLRDAPCEEERRFLCKSSEATDWFEERPGRGVAGLGEPQRLYPSAASLAQAKRECLQERCVCLAVLQTGSGFYLISSLEGTALEAESTLFVRTLCAEGFGGPDCRVTSAHPPRPTCDCTGRFQTTVEKVCGIPVQTCVDDCRRTTAWSNCSLCLPACTEASLSGLDPEELALITMIQFKVSRSLNLTAEDERDRRNSSKIIYDAKYP